MSTPIGAQRHKTLLGTEPTAKQLQLYEVYPTYRGLSDPSLNSDVLEAVLISALTSGSVQDRVLVFAPPKHETWVIDGFNRTADALFERCKDERNAVRVAKGFQLLLNKLLLTGRVHQLKAEPEHWAAFGFSVDDAIPEWLASKLRVV